MDSHLFQNQESESDLIPNIFRIELSYIQSQSIMQSSRDTQEPIAFHNQAWCKASSDGTAFL